LGNSAITMQGLIRLSVDCDDPLPVAN